MLIVRTANPRTLLRKIRTQIAEGKIETWTYDKDGDFTHTPRQWRELAWLHPEVKTNALVFTILPTEGVPLTLEVNGVYFGRFAEMLLIHFPDEFSVIEISPPS
jgi:hypothetical protein